MQRIADEAAPRQGVQPVQQQRQALAQQQRQAPAQQQQQRRHFIAAINTFTGGVKMEKYEWMVDTGAEAHVTSSEDNLLSFEAIKGTCETVFHMPDQRVVRPVGVGSIAFISEKYRSDLVIKEVHVVPNLPNLLSVKALSRAMGVPVTAVLLRAKRDGSQHPTPTGHTTR